MINEVYNSFQEAEKRAETLLWNDRPQGTEKMVCTTETSDGWDGLPKKPHFITMEGSEAYAIILNNEYKDINGAKHETAYLTYVADGDRLTYPYRSLQRKDTTFLLMVMFSNIPTHIKPGEPITAKEAATAAGEERLRHFFGVGYEDFKKQGELLEAIRKGEKEAFEEEWDGEEHYLSAAEISPALLSEAMGKPVRDLKEYNTATESLIGHSLNDEEKEAQYFAYYFQQVELFGLYCLYSFLRTEKYADLKRVEKEYQVFGLPKGWDKGSIDFVGDIVEAGETIEEAVLNHYYNTGSKLTGSHIDLREIADYTGAPLKLVYEAMGESRVAKTIRRRFNDIKRKHNL